MRIFKGSIIKNAREKKGYTTRALADLALHKGVKIDHSSLTRWENLPTAKPRQQALEVICEILEINEDLYEEIEVDEIEESIDVTALISKIIDINKADEKDYRLIQIKKILFP